MKADAFQLLGVSQEVSECSGYLWIEVEKKKKHAERCQRRSKHLRQVVEVLYSASWPDSDPVDLVVQSVQEETQELLSILLAVGNRCRDTSADATVRGHVSNIHVCSGTSEQT